MGSKYAKMLLEDKSLGYELVASTRIREKNALKLKDYLNMILIQKKN